MKPLVIYHASCADGFAAAFAAWLKLGDEAEYVPCQYGQVKNVADLNSILSSAGIPFGEGEVYVLDFSFPKDVMEWLFKEVKRVVWLDHHASIFKDFGVPISDVADEITLGLMQPNNHHIRLNNTKSGALLSWEYFHPGTEVPMFIKHIDDYDRWQFKIEGTKAFQKALWSYAPWSFEQWNHFFANHKDLWSGKIKSVDLTCFYDEGNAILRAHDANVQAVVKAAARECEIAIDDGAGHDYRVLPGLAANCPPHLTSDVGHELATQSGTFGLLWFIDKDNVCRCSLRSNGDYDVSAIAKAFGGGGHRNAAGFQVDIQTLLGWLK